MDVILSMYKVYRQTPDVATGKFRQFSKSRVTHTLRHSIFSKFSAATFALHPISEIGYTPQVR